MSELKRAVDISANFVAAGSAAVRRMGWGRGMIISAFAGLAMLAIPGLSSRSQAAIRDFGDTISGAATPVARIEPAPNAPGNVTNLGRKKFNPDLTPGS